MIRGEILKILATVIFAIWLITYYWGGYLRRQFYLLTTHNPVIIEHVFNFVHSKANPLSDQQSVAYGKQCVWVAYPSGSGTKVGVIQQYDMTGNLLNEFDNIDTGHASSMCFIDDSLYVLGYKSYNDKQELTIVDSKTGKYLKRYYPMNHKMVWDGITAVGDTLIFLGVSATKWSLRQGLSPNQVADTIAICMYVDGNLISFAKKRWTPYENLETTQGIGVDAKVIFQLTSQFDNCNRYHFIIERHPYNYDMNGTFRYLEDGRKHQIQIPTYLCHGPEGAFVKNHALYFSIHKSGFGLYKIENPNGLFE